MHEIHAARRIAQIAAARACESGIQVVKTVHVSVSALTHLTPDGLRHAFEAIAGEYGLLGAELRVETSPPSARCEECGEVFATPDARDFDLRCSKCGSARVALDQAQEVEVSRIT